jgi:hypothetical protein
MRNFLLNAVILQFLIMSCMNTGHNSKTNRYFIDSQNGTDTNSGISVSSPWKSLEKLKQITFQPGDSILFAKNAVFQGGIPFESSGTAENPIVISNYGEGSLPLFSNPDQNTLNGNVFQLAGSHIVLDGLSFEKCADANSKSGKSVLEAGAIFTRTGADHITVKNCEFTDCPIGVNFTGQHSLITRSVFRDCNRYLSEPHWGPLGIVIANAYNEISYNTCMNYVNIGGTFGADGGFIELDDRYFGTKVHDVKIHHNKSFENMGFLEIETNVEGANIDVYYNLSDDYQQFIFYWGGDSSKIENNTVIRTKPSLNGAVNTVFTMKNGNFTLRNNIFVTANGVQTFITAPYDVGNYGQIVHEHNLYYCTDGTTDDPCGKPLGSGELIANPEFVNMRTGDYHLSTQSPAIDSSKDLRYVLDLDDVPVGNGNAPDMGAYEKRTNVSHESGKGGN